MLKKILIAVAVLVLVFIVVVSMQPSEFRVTRSAEISAPAAVVFAYVNDFHNWEAWSPWAKLDPNSKVVFEGPTAGTGAIFKWSGNDQVGVGSNTIIESRPDELVRIKLEFLKPFEGISTAEFTFKTEGDKTIVNWSMFGHNNFIGKAISLFMDCDKMVGGQFEQGLAQLKTISEKAAGK